MLAGGAVAVALLLPGTLDSRRTLEIERAATPTPTADVRSMLMVTLDPANTPAPTPMLLKTGVKGDEVTRLQQRLQELVTDKINQGIPLNVIADRLGLDEDSFKAKFSLYNELVRLEHAVSEMQP